METDQLWKLTVLDTSDDTEKDFLMKALGYEKERLLEILREIHPEYDNVKLDKVEA